MDILDFNCSRLMADTEHSSPSLADDCVYRTIEHYRKPGALSSALAEAWPEGALRKAQVTQTYYNPYSRARLVAEAVLDEPASPTQMLSIKIFSTPERAAEVYARALTKKTLPTVGPAVMRLSDGYSVAWWLPNGQNLRKIGVCFDPAGFRDFLNKKGIAQVEGELDLPRLVRYVPRRRAVFRWKSPANGNFYFKFYSRTTCGASRNLRELNRLGSALGFRVPRLLRYNKKRNVVAMDEVPGIPLTALLPVATVQDLARVGAALAALHGASIKTRVSWSAQGEIDVLLDATAEMKRALPHLGPSLHALVIQLAADCPSQTPLSPIHANLFGDQILVSDEEIGIVDWDDLACGDPLYDLGRLVAHLIYLSVCDSVKPALAMEYLEALLDAYAEASEKNIDYARLRWHVAVALLMRAKISALRPLEANWGTHVGESIAAAQLVLEGRWLP